MQYHCRLSFINKIVNKIFPRQTKTEGVATSRPHLQEMLKRAFLPKQKKGDLTKSKEDH